MADNETTGITAAPLPLQPDYYPLPGRLDKELKAAPGIYGDFAAAVKAFIDSVRLGQSVDLTPLGPFVDAMVVSIIRQPEAMVWMRRMDTELSYLTGHATRCAALSAVICRGMGLPEPQIRRALLGGLLCQIGKTQIPRSLLEKSEALTDEEMQRVKSFVSLGAIMIEESGHADREIIDIIACHQERWNGSGYPQGLRGDGIPLLARIVGLADWYDALTTKKPHTSRVLSATEAMDFLYSQRDESFQEQLVEVFIRIMGIYPTGNLVELSGGELALVQAQTPGHRTQPQVVIVSDSRGKRLKKYVSISLFDYNQKTDGRPLTIKRGLGAGYENWNPREIMETWAAQKRGRWFGRF